jgi:geranylgeranyl diphosphate synthase type I
MQKDFFAIHKEQISAYIHRFLAAREQTSTAALFGSDVIKRLQEFLSEGKMVRGGLLLLSAEMFSGEIDENALIAASALEIIHASLLIHDDIMDNDRIRRGRQTLFAQYVELAQNENLQHPEGFGQSMGICVGDIGFFLAFELLTKLSINPDAKTKLLQLFSSELTMVGLMQMQDVYFGNTHQPVHAKDVLSLYTYKTARYTFSLPLMAGALLTDQPAAINSQLAKLGESLGIIFQIKDDELGLFGTEEQIGKPVGSDIREDKKTLFAFYLFEQATTQQQAKLRTIFGNPDLTPEMIAYVRELLEVTGTRRKVQGEITKLQEVATRIITDLPVEEQYKVLLHNLAVYNVNRTK